MLKSQNHTMLFQAQSLGIGWSLEPQNCSDHFAPLTFQTVEVVEVEMVEEDAQKQLQFVHVSLGRVASEVGSHSRLVEIGGWGQEEPSS
ncbi:hypothetical protein Bca4012_075713 [Brassica carinata]